MNVIRLDDTEIEPEIKRLLSSGKLTDEDKGAIDTLLYYLYDNGDYRYIPQLADKLLGKQPKIKKRNKNNSANRKNRYHHNRSDICRAIQKHTERRKNLKSIQNLYRQIKSLKIRRKQKNRYPQIKK